MVELLMSDTCLLNKGMRYVPTPGPKLDVLILYARESKSLYSLMKKKVETPLPHSNLLFPFNMEIVYTLNINHTGYII